MNLGNLVRGVLERYSLPLEGTHGVSHWARVLENGVRLSMLTGAKLEVVQLFSIFHDLQRVNERKDPDHGRRGAELAIQMRGTLFDLSDQDFALLFTACSHHTDGSIDGDITVQTCWDADRLDLGRVGKLIQTKFLCTEPARNEDMILWADERARKRIVPELVNIEWKIL